MTGIAKLGDGSKMYRLLSGLYITANPKYVEFIPAEKLYEPWAAKVVNTKALNVRETPNGNVMGQLQAVTVTGEEPDSDGDIWYKVSSGNMTGFVWPDYIEK